MDLQRALGAPFGPLTPLSEVVLGTPQQHAHARQVDPQSDEYFRGPVAAEAQMLAKALGPQLPSQEDVVRAVLYGGLGGGLMAAPGAGSVSAFMPYQLVRGPRKYRGVKKALKRRHLQPWERKPGPAEQAAHERLWQDWQAVVEPKTGTLLTEVAPQVKESVLKRLVPQAEYGLPQLLHNAEQFTNVLPGLKDVVVKRAKGAGNYYLPSEKTIVLDTPKRTGSFLHEMQHAVQDAAGLPGGASAKGLLKYPPDNPQSFLDALARIMGKTHPPPAELDDRMKAVLRFMQDQGLLSDELKTALKKERDLWFGEGRFMQDTASLIYNNTLGEVMARAAEEMKGSPVHRIANEMTRYSPVHTDPREEFMRQALPMTWMLSRGLQ